LQILKKRQEDKRLEKNSTKEETSSQFPKGDIGIKHKKYTTLYSPECENSREIGYKSRAVKQKVLNTTST
jgi:hypothetical protein